MSCKAFLGLLSLTLTITGYYPYFRSIFKGETKPHLFSWIIWALVNGVAFAGQFSKGAGAGAWTTGFTALICVLVAGLSVRYGEKHITRSDWISFVVAVAAIPIWYATHDPLDSILLVTFIDIAGCYPTLRKSYNSPYEENVFTWTINSFRSLFSLFAIEIYSATTLFFPVAMLFTNGGIALMLVWRRYRLKPTENV